MTTDNHNDDCAEQHSPVSARNLDEASAHVYSNVKFFFGGNDLRYARARTFVADMEAIGNRRMWRMAWFCLCLGAVLGAGIIRLSDCCFR